MYVWRKWGGASQWTYGGLPENLTMLTKQVDSWLACVQHPPPPLPLKEKSGKGIGRGAGVPKYMFELVKQLSLLHN